LQAKGYVYDARVTKDATARMLTFFSANR